MKRNLFITLTAIATAFCCRRFAFMAGHSVRPGLATFFSIIGFWLPLLGAVLIAFQRNKAHRSINVLSKILFCSICLLPMLIPYRNRDDGFQGFIKRMKEDIEPKEMRSKLAMLGKNADSSRTEFQLAGTDWNYFGKTNIEYAMPAFTFVNHHAMIRWGSDFQMWGIMLDTNTICDYPWTNDLYFFHIEK